MLVRDLDLHDGGAAWALAGKVDHRVHRLGLALERSFDGAVGAVANPAGDAARLGHAPGRVAEEDALHAPPDDDALADHGHRPRYLFVVLVVVAGGLRGQAAAVQLVGGDGRHWTETRA